MKRPRCSWLIIGLLVACGGAESTSVPTIPAPTQTLSVAGPTIAASPTTTTVTATPLQVQIKFAAYVAYRVQPSDTLDSISGRGGSLPVIVAAYNHFAGEPAVDQPLIVPQLEGTSSNLPSTPTLVTRGNITRPRAALLFELGPNVGSMLPVLETLSAADAQATFFLSSSWIDAHPTEVRQMLAEGHQLANFVPDATLDNLPQRISATETALHRAVDLSATLRPLLRLPTSDDPAVQSLIVAAGYLPVGQTFDSSTSTSIVPDQLAGALIVVDAESLPTMLRVLAEHSISARTLSEVLGP